MSNAERSFAPASAPNAPGSPYSILCIILWLSVFMGWASFSAFQRPADDAPLPVPLEGVDPNTAPWWELAALPRIGESTARAIVSYREEQTPASGDPQGAVVFRQPSDLINVRGIGIKTVESIAPFLRFDAAAEPQR